MDMTRDRWERTNGYIQEVFGRDDEQLATLMKRAVEAGLPDIAVSADVGRLLTLLVSMTRAERVVEVGTLGGYSGIWLARGLAPGGQLITIEREDKHADFAEREFASAGVGDRVRIERGAALDVLPRLAGELGPNSLDVVFLDAVKVEYAEYLAIVGPMLRVGGLVLADNALSGGDWWICDAPGDPGRDAMDTFNRALADDPHFTTACCVNRNGLLVAKKAR
jgi:caffeoyl-CoA O-methyltransferase